MPAKTFSSFKKLLVQDATKCLQQFRYLIAQGSSSSRAVLKYLDKIYSNQNIDAEYLMNSLAILRQLDLTNIWPITLPGIHIYGQNDAIVPQQANQLMQADKHKIFVIQGHGHAPFLENLQNFIALMEYKDL